MEEWRNLLNNWSDLPGIVVCIDGTSHEIYMPGDGTQRLYYSGHRKYHCIHSVVIIANVAIWIMLAFIDNCLKSHQMDSYYFQVNAGCWRIQYTHVNIP